VNTLVKDFDSALYILNRVEYAATGKLLTNQSLQANLSGMFIFAATRDEIMKSSM